MPTLEKLLYNKFKEANRKEAIKKAKREKELDNELSINNMDLGEPEIVIPKPKQTTVHEAEKISLMKQKLVDEFKTQHQREVTEVENLEKKYKPITKAIKETVSQDIVPVVVPHRFASSTPKTQRMIRFEDDDDYDYDEESSSYLDSPEKDTFRRNQSLKQLVDAKIISLGPIASEFIGFANDGKFGIYFDVVKKQPMIGEQVIAFDNDDIIIVSTKKKYRGTKGLWRLLTRNDYFEKTGMYTDEDWANYADILIETNSLFQGNNPKSRAPKASRGDKWKYMIKKLWYEFKKTEYFKKITAPEENSESEEMVGSGLAEYNEKPVEYKYLNNIGDVIKLLQFMDAQEMAGNNNFHNEKLGLAKFIGDRLEEMVVQSPKGMKILLRVLTALPESAIKGSGLVNDFLNSKWMPELHWPGYQYLGPFTKLDKRLKRGDKGINPSDAAAKKHDIWYRDHKDVESRNIADKVLLDELWERVKSDDAPLIGEKLPALVGTGAMWLKTKLGMGLSTSSYVYPD